MRDFVGNTAVVTGAASGIGRALAERFVREGMRVVLADRDDARLAAVSRELEDSGGTVLAVSTDVARAEEVEALAARSFAAFGGVHVLCNNAGIAGTFAPVWELTPEDWRRVLDCNLWGVIHGVRAFVPRMLAQDGDAHIVNTASLAGLVRPGACWAGYSATKHAVVTLSEALEMEFRLLGSRMHVLVLCPGMVHTDLGASLDSRGDLASQVAARTRGALDAGIDAADVADRAVAAIREERFYVLTHPADPARLRWRADAVLAGHNPAP